MHFIFNNSIIFFIFILLAQNISSETNIPSQDDKCVIEHNGEKLNEGDIVDIQNKIYKVEDCQLHRAYHVCGTHIIFIINIVCEAIEQYQIMSSKTRFTRFVQQKLLTEACCQNLCTVSEMTRYCPR
jgi:hypothetical protein